MTVIVDAIIGAVTFGVISYISQPNMLGNNTYYFQIFGLLWSLPISYFFLLLIASKISTTAMMNLSRHIGLGAMLTIFTVYICLYMQGMDQSIIIIVNLLITILFIVLYFGFDIYKIV